MQHFSMGSSGRAELIPDGRKPSENGRRSGVELTLDHPADDHVGAVAARKAGDPRDRGGVAMGLPQAPRVDDRDLGAKALQLRDHRAVLEEDHEPLHCLGVAVLDELAQHDLAAAALLRERHHQRGPHRGNVRPHDDRRMADGRKGFTEDQIAWAVPPAVTVVAHDVGTPGGMERQLGELCTGLLDSRLPRHRDRGALCARAPSAAAGDPRPGPAAAVLARLSGVLPAGLARGRPSP